MINFSKATDPVYVDKIIGLISADVGVGKSSFALSIENSLILDFEKNIQRVDKGIKSNSTSQIVEVNSSNYQEVIDYIPRAKADGFKAIVIDTIGSLQDVVLQVVRANPRLKIKDNRRVYGELATELAFLHKRMEETGLDIIYLSHISEKMVNEETKLSQDIVGKTKNLIKKDCNIMCCVAKDEYGRRFLTFAYPGMEIKGPERMVKQKSITFNQNDYSFGTNFLYAAKQGLSDTLPSVDELNARLAAFDANTPKEAKLELMRIAGIARYTFSKEEKKFVL